MTENLDEFLDKLDYPMYIVTTVANGEKSGCLVGFLTQSSIDPPRFLVCLSEKNHTYRTAREASVLAVHLVPKDAVELVRLFGSETGDQTDKFTKCSWSPGPEGVPLLDDCPSRMVCKILDGLKGGDHTAFLAEPMSAQAGDEQVFTFRMAQAEDLKPGHPA